MRAKNPRLVSRLKNTHISLHHREGYTSIWSYNPTTNDWKRERTCKDDSAPDWLAWLMRQAKGAPCMLVISKTKPSRR